MTQEPSRSRRVLEHLRRWGLLWAAVGVALLLVGSTASTRFALRAHMDGLTAIHEEFVVHHIEGPPDDLRQELHRLRPFGVMALLRFEPDGLLSDRAGRTEGPFEPIGSTSVRLGRGMHRVDVPLADGTLLGVEYVPLLAHDMARRTSRALTFSVVASLLLIGFAGFWVRQRLQLEAAQLQAERTRQLALLGTLSSVVAHELRNPLTVLLGHLQLLREDLPTNERLTHVEEGAHRLDELLDSLLQFARSGEIQPENVEPDLLVLQAIAEADVGRAEVEGTAPPWPLDPVRMGQVFVNLLHNARAASPEGAVVVRLTVEEGVLVVDVQDEGPGLPEEGREQLFEPFITTKTRGTGLGLPIARGIVERHGGTLVALDAPTGGALFRMRIPR